MDDKKGRNYTLSTTTKFSLMFFGPCVIVYTYIDQQINAHISLLLNNVYYTVFLDMFRASLCSSSGGKLYIYSFWYRGNILDHILVT